MMKKSLHVINILLLLCEAAAGAAVLFYAEKFSLMPYICGAVAVIMSIVIFIMGALLPKQDTVPGKKQQKAAKAAVLANAVLNHAVPSSAEIDIVTGKKGLCRSWEPLAVTIWFLLQSLAAIFVIIPASGVLRASAAASVAILLLLIFTSAAWKAADNKEKYGNPMLKKIILPIGIFLCVIAVLGMLSYLKESRKWTEGGFPDAAFHDRPQEAVQKEETPASGDTKKRLLDKVSADFPGEMLYYRMLEQENSKCTLVVWNDTEDTVYLYLLKKEKQDSYIIENKMISDSLIKADVEGKEEGVFGKKAKISG